MGRAGSWPSGPPDSQGAIKPDCEQVVMARAELFTIQTEKGASMGDSLVRIDEQLRITYKEL